MQLAQSCGLLLDGRVGGQVEEQRPHLRAEKVVGAGGAERSEGRRRLRGEEVEHDVGVRQTADDAPVCRRKPAHDGREHGRTLVSLRVRQAAVARSRRPERLRAALLREVALRLVDQREGERLRLLGRVGPRDHAVAAEDDPGQLGLREDEVTEAEAEIEARPLPVEPAEPAAESPRDVLAPVRGGRERDQRVGMEMVDVQGGEKSVQGRVDRRHRTARPEAGVVEQADHLVLVVETLVDALHRAQALEVDEGEPGRPSACRGRRRSPSPRARFASRP